MIDIKILRENPDCVREAIANKGSDCDLDAILEMDKERRQLISSVETLRAEQKSVNSEMAALQKGSEEFLAKVAEMRRVAAEVKAGDSALKSMEETWGELILTVPNIPDSSVPVAPDPSGNAVHFTWGDKDAVSPHAKAHYDLEVFNQYSDFPRGAKVTGAGWPFFKGGLARLIRSLINFYLDQAKENGYEELMAPLVVNEASARATGQLPDKEGQMYVIPQEGFYMIPTSEVPVTNFFRDEILDESELPVYRSCYTPCFRREAGSHGKDVRGLNRTHQFDKVELVKWVHPENSYNELESLKENAESLMQKLNLPYRVLLMCTGDLGFTQSKKYDLEVWAGGQERWLEVSSCSNFEAFQARRANIRFRPQGGKPVHVHTLNGSGLAVPRVLAAILENNVLENGNVKIPNVLVEYFGGGTLK
ncbi:MAG: serine--tRNA ligase [Opitutaceae bacterium]|nr:serine--tRNA ligase [Opitutaceae bacterium]|tara:strand:- start:310 stop:1572 length:1263 start_codon:yes stop_codon:yes gene_type:complete